MGYSAVIPPARSYLPVRDIVERSGSISIVSLDPAKIGRRSRQKSSDEGGIKPAAGVLHRPRVAIAVAMGCSTSFG
jgi:hypothetical protein